MKQDKGYNYWERNIAINRSKPPSLASPPTHRRRGDFGHPYRGFLSRELRQRHVRDCFVHRSQDLLDHRRRRQNPSAWAPTT